MLGPIQHPPLSPTDLAKQIDSAKLAHAAAIRRWLAANPSDRAGLWPAVEAAWRDIDRLRASSDAHHHAIETFARHGKIRRHA